MSGRSSCSREQEETGLKPGVRKIIPALGSKNSGVRKRFPALRNRKHTIYRESCFREQDCPDTRVPCSREQETVRTPAMLLLPRAGETFGHLLLLLPRAGKTFGHPLFFARGGVHALSRLPSRSVAARKESMRAGRPASNDRGGGGGEGTALRGALPAVPENRSRSAFQAL